MPRGPPGLPILGNLFDIPKVSAHEVYLNMRNEYGKLPPLDSDYVWDSTHADTGMEGPVFSLDLAGQPLVIVNSMKAAQDLYGKGRDALPHTCRST